MDFKNFKGQGIFFFARARTRSIFSLFAFILIAVSTESFGLSTQQRKAIQQISSQKLDQCLPAIDSLGNTKTLEAVSPLMSAYRTESRGLVRRYIIDSLARIGSREALSTFQAALQDADVQVRQSAVVALSMQASKEAEDSLLAHAAKESDFSVKAHLAPALGRCKDKKAMDVLTAWSKDKNPEMKRLANEGIEHRKRKVK